MTAEMGIVFWLWHFSFFVFFFFLIFFSVFLFSYFFFLSVSQMDQLPISNAKTIFVCSFLSVSSSPYFVEKRDIDFIEGKCTVCNFESFCFFYMCYSGSLASVFDLSQDLLVYDMCILDKEKDKKHIRDEKNIILLFLVWWTLWMVSEMKIKLNEE